MLRIGLLLGMTAVAVADTGNLPPFEIAPIENPVPARASASTLSPSESGRLWLAWSQGDSVSVASYNEATHRWSNPRLAVVAAAKGAPSVAAHRADVCAVWEGSGGVQAVLSKDEGSNWGPPLRLDLDGRLPVVSPLADGRFEVAWVRDAGGKTSIEACSISSDGSSSDPVLAAENACPDSPLSLAPLEDGGALLAYRSLNVEHGIDPHLVRLRHGVWGQPRFMASDGWTSLESPKGGPSLAVDGGRVAASWYCGGDNEPRMLVSGSPDAGDRFLMPLTLDTPVAEQTPAVALLHDGAYLCAWAGADGIRLGRVTPDFVLQPSVRLGDTYGDLQSLSMALARDYAGGTSAAEVLVLASWKSGNRPSAYRVSVPEAEILAASDPNCHCMPTPAELVGFPVRGRVVSKTLSTVTFSHPEIAGVMDEGTLECLADPGFIASLDTGYAFLGRIERRAGQWQLYDIRVLVERADSAAPTPRGP